MGFLGGSLSVNAVCAFSFLFFTLLHIPVSLFVPNKCKYAFFSLGHFLNCSTVCMRQICFIASTLCDTGSDIDR